MRARLLAAACLVLSGVGLSFAAAAPYRALKGDTLWDLAGKRWKNPFAWPELWSLNPHISNPHEIEPGDPIFFDRRSSGAEIRLPLDRLGPIGPRTEGGTVAVAPAGAGSVALGRGAVAPVLVERRKAGDFVSAHRVDRWATVTNRGTGRVIFSLDDEIEFRVTPASRLQPGDLATVFDDSLPVVHPVNRAPQGYLVHVLGQVRVRSVAGSRGVGRLVESYDTVSDGAGVMPYRETTVSVSPKGAKGGIEGVVLQGNPEKALFCASDVVFLDRGSLHGLEPGAVLEIPVADRESRSLEGLVDLGRPLAHLLVFSVEDKSAAGLIVDSRATIEIGDRFIAAAVSP
ncbi:MAG: LysM peptidoglycan-binding domain-containing protein [Deltaproteobacteria bacterium]|nr:LysM peptidoglycan-binding domain-containing protein [Deltaproteobacteria bacterium]